MTQQVHVAVCHNYYGDAFVYLFNDKDEAQQFAEDVAEHSDDVLVKTFPVTPTTRKQALSDLLGV